MVSTARADGTIQASVVNAGVLDHPTANTPVIGFVTYGKVKLANLRARPNLVVVVRSGWQWVAAEGRAELIGPDDPAGALQPDGLRRLLQEIFRSAGGSHDDWDAYDLNMVEQHRTAVLIEPVRIYSN